MTDDLVKRLRCYADLDDAVFHPWVYSEAADRIEASGDALKVSLETCMEMSERNKELEAALRSIAANTCCDKCQEAALVARAALGEKQND